MKKLLFTMFALIFLASCGKDEMDPQVWKVDAPFGTVTVKSNNDIHVTIQKNGSQTFYKQSYTHIDVWCDNCAYRVNGVQHGVRTRFYRDGRQEKF